MIRAVDTSYMQEETALIERRLAYIAKVRSLHKGKRNAAFVGCLVGVMAMMFGRFRYTDFSPVMLWGGLAVVLLSWATFLFVSVQRARYVRAHPFEG
jgi:hypothetical protein